MKDWRETLIGPTATIHQAIKAIDSSSRQIALVVDGEDRLLGTVTDGDIRRAILRGADMDAPVGNVMKDEPHVARESDSNESLLNRMVSESVRQFPLLDDGGRVTGLVYIDDLMSPAEKRDNWVVIMAGGLGTRLRPLTDSAPKPLLPVGDKPLMETIVEGFLEHEFRQFYISVNYKAEMIKEHFGDGEKWNATIRYIHEDRPLGTAGALRLIKDRPEAPIIVMNGDLLTRVNFQHLLDYHREHKARATMCVREYDFQVPFGVVKIADNRITGIDEKPLHSFFVNAGIYVLDPELIDLIPKGEFFDMTTLFEAIIAAEHNTAVFPIREYWIDVGRINELNQANGDFGKEFK